MTSVANVLYVMIASPGDVAEAREAVYRALSRWNESNSRNRGLVLLPLRWETGTVPELGDHPQSIINRQLLHDADIVVALFGSRVGSATPTAISGTVEEIEHAIESGKPVHLYFSTAPHANDVDLEQLKALRDFRKALEERGLYGTFNSIDELTAHIWQAIEHDIAQLGLGSPDATTKKVRSVEILVQAGSERLPKTDSKGKLRYETKRWIDVLNRGDLDAEQLTINSLDPGVILVGPEKPKTLHAGQSQRFAYLQSWGAGDPQFKLNWVEDGESREKVFDI